eukprot:191630-Prorocentrum_minimum.AAC.1
MDQSDAGRTGIYILTTDRTNRTRGYMYSHDGPIGPIGRRTREYILTTDQSDQSDAGCASIFPQRTNRTNRTQDAR